MARAVGHADLVGAEYVELDTFLAAASKAGLVWVQVGRGRARPLWTIWHEEALHSVVGGPEQPDPFGPLPRLAEVTVPSKDTRAALLRIPMTAILVPPGTARWVAATSALRTARLNAPFDRDLPEIWATESVVVRLVPAGDVRVADARDNALVGVDVGWIRARGWRRMRGHLRPRQGRSTPPGNLTR